MIFMTKTGSGLLFIQNNNCYEIHFIKIAYDHQEYLLFKNVKLKIFKNSTKCPNIPKYTKGHFTKISV